MSSHRNLSIQRTFRNFWANVSKLTIKESVSDDTNAAIKDGLKRVETTRIEKQ